MQQGPTSKALSEVLSKLAGSQAGLIAVMACVYCYDVMECSAA